MAIPVRRRAADVVAFVFASMATAFGLWLLWLAIRKGELVRPMWVRRRLSVEAAELALSTDRT